MTISSNNRRGIVCPVALYMLGFHVAWAHPTLKENIYAASSQYTPTVKVCYRRVVRKRCMSLWSMKAMKCVLDSEGQLHTWTQTDYDTSCTKPIISEGIDYRHLKSTCSLDNIIISFIFSMLQKLCLLSEKMALCSTLSCRKLFRYWQIVKWGRITFAMNTSLFSLHGNSAFGEQWEDWANLHLNRSWGQVVGMWLWLTSLAIHLFVLLKTNNASTIQTHTCNDPFLTKTITTISNYLVFTVFKSLPVQAQTELEISM